MGAVILAKKIFYAQAHPQARPERLALYLKVSGIFDKLSNDEAQPYLRLARRRLAVKPRRSPPRPAPTEAQRRALIDELTTKLQATDSSRPEYLTLRQKLAYQQSRLNNPDKWQS